MKLSSTEGNLDSQISLRPASEEDVPFLLRLYVSTRKDEFDVVSWPEGQREAIEQMQFRAQRMYYSQQWPQAQHSVIQFKSCDAGRLYVDRNGSEISVIDISLLPEFRSQGIGGAVFKALIQESDTSGKAISLSALRSNQSAIAFYGRLGFVEVGETPTHLYYRREPN